MAEARLRSTESLSKEKSMQLDWHQDTMNAPYYQLGNRKHEAAGIMDQRNKIKHTPAVRESINRFWQLFSKNSLGLIEKQPYISLHERISRFLTPCFPTQELRSAVEEDWIRDSEGESSMSYTQFSNSLFQVAEVWSEEISPSAYADFLSKVFRRVTCKKGTSSEGGKEIKPVIQLVFPDELQRELDWEVALSDEDYDSDFEYNYEVDGAGNRKRTKRLKGSELMSDPGVINYDEVVLDCWDEAVCGEVLELAEISEIVPLGKIAESYLTSIFRKDIAGYIEMPKLAKEAVEGKQVVVIGDSIRYKIKQQTSSGFVSLKRAVVKTVGDKLHSAKPSGRKGIHDFSLGLLKSESKDSPVSIERTPVTTLEELRKDLLQSKYQPVIKRLERRVSMQVKKGLIEVEREKRKAVVEEVEVPLKPIESLKSLYSAETQLPTDPFMNINDIIDVSTTDVLKILIIGPPRSGRTTLAEELCKALDLHHIEFSSIITRLLARGIKNEDEEGEELEEGEKRPEIYNDFEKSVISALDHGDSVSPDQFLQLLATELSSDVSNSKGFILDIPLLPPYLEFIHSIQFNFVAHLNLTSTDLEIRNRSIKWDPSSNLVYTQWHIAELLKPIPKKDDEEAEEEEDTGPKINVNILLDRAEDYPHHYSEALTLYYASTEPDLLRIPRSLPESLKIHTQSSGLLPEELRQIVIAKLGHRVIKPPASKKLEPEANPKSLLLQEVEENQEPRNWSIWKQIDPVALYETRLVPGKPDFAAEYSGNVFLFDSEINQEKFVKYPQKYLQNPPKVPKELRLAIVGPCRSGKRTQAQYLCAKYGWKLIDVPEVLQLSLQSQKKHMKDPQPSHPDTGLVQAQDGDFRKVLAGDSLAANTVLPIVLNKQGIPLRKKPPPPPTPKSELEEGEDEEDKKSEDPEKKGEEEAEVDDDVEGNEDDENNKEKVEGAEEAKLEGGENAEGHMTEEAPVEREPTPPIVYEDLPLTEIVLKPDEAGGNPRLQGFIMIGYPYTEEEAAALKEFNIEFDKILYLVDPADGETLVKRGAEALVDLQKDLAAVDQAIVVCKDAFGEENVLEIPINGSEEEVHDRICRALDPFYVYIDDTDNIVGKEEAGEEAINTTASEYGPYDPVILTEHNWLMPGSEEFEVQCLGKRYTFVSEAEAEKFKKQPQLYRKIEPTQVPQPHIMITGPRGSGVRTLIEELCSKYQIPVLELKQTYLSKLEEERTKRRRARLLRRGFVGKETNEEDEPFDPLINDPEITEEDEGFDKAAHEREIMQRTLQGNDPLIINAKWFEVEEEKVSQPLVDLLFESRRLPEIILILRATEATTVDRLLDRDGITNKYQELMEIRRKEKERVKEEARREKAQARMDRIAAGEEVEDEEEVEEEEVDDADDPEAPNLEAMLDEAKQKLIEMRESDNSAIDEVKEAFEGKNIKVFEVQTEGQLSRLMQKITHELSKIMSNRSALIERNLPIKLRVSKANELLSKNKAKLSCFHELCPVTPEYPIDKSFPVLFRDRIYYPGSESDQDKLVQSPWLYLSQDTHPKDVDLKIFASILGGPCSGKSSLAKDLQQALGVVRINLRGSVQMVLRQSSELALRVKEELSKGKALDEHLAVEVIHWRLGMQDVLNHGCVLDGFPQTAAQAVTMANRGLVPSPILLLTCGNFCMSKRLSSKFKHNRSSLKLQLKYAFNTSETVAWYHTAYENVRYLSSEYSKWWVKDTAITAINQVFSTKRQYAIALIKKTPVHIKHLPITRFDMNKRFGKFKRYDPVQWKYRSELIEVKSNEFIVEFNTRLYAFSNRENMDVFMENPGKIIQTRPLPEHLPRKLLLSECGDIYESRIELESNCLVTLAEQGVLVKGNQTILASYADKIYTFTEVSLREKFVRKPQRYEKTKLPVKIPPKADNMVNFVLKEFETSIGFLDQMLGQVIIKALLEVGSQKLMFPLLSPKETALKHFCLFLKANNPQNSAYQKEKYGKKLRQFKQQCFLQGELYEEGVRKDNNELKEWETENYFEQGEKYDEFLNDLRKNIDTYIDKFIR